MGEEKVCPGCGAPLQSEDETKEGYVPAGKIDEENIICRRCYRIKHYGEAFPVSLSGDEYWNELKKMLKFAKTVVKVVDIVDFEGSWNERLFSACRGKKMVLAVNKMDNLPKNISENEVQEWLRKRLGSHLKNFVEIFFVSAKQGKGIDAFASYIRRKVGKGNIIFAGATNVGKSSLINKVAEELIGGNRFPVTESKFPGTTLQSLKVNIPGEKLILWDSPGVPVKGRLGDFLCPACGSSLLPVGEINRKTFKLAEGQTLMLGAVASFTLVSADNGVVLQCFAPGGVSFHLTKREKMEHLRLEHGGGLLVPPCSKCMEKIAQETGYREELIALAEGEDIAISGLGWISLRRGTAEFNVSLLKDLAVVKRSALIAPKKE